MQTHQTKVMPNITPLSTDSELIVYHRHPSPIPYPLSPTPPKSDPLPLTILGAMVCVALIVWLWGQANQSDRVRELEQQTALQQARIEAARGVLCKP